MDEDLFDGVVKVVAIVVGTIAALATAASGVYKPVKEMNSSLTEIREETGINTSELQEIIESGDAELIDKYLKSIEE